MNVLMLGSGHHPMLRRFTLPNSCPDADVTWTRLDINSDCNPDVVFDLNQIEQGGRLPFYDEQFDEIHAYEVLEHYGTLGDYKGFFRGMKEIWRVTKPKGWFVGTTPKYGTRWTFGDPGHTRVIQAETLNYLAKEMYNFGDTTVSDYRKYVEPCWWGLKHCDDTSDVFIFGLQKC